MTLEIVRNALLWCSILNYGLLLAGVLVFALPHEWAYRIWARWFRISREQFDTIAVASLAIYKTGIILFNLIPYIALRIVA
jgi:hypothetical protein